MQVAINALPTAPGGGLTNLLGLLRGFQQLSEAPDVTVFASHRETLEAVDVYGCDVRVIRIPKMTLVKRFAWEQTRLPALLQRVRADVLLCSNFAVPALSVPQVVQHQDLHTLSGWTRWSGWRRATKVFFQKVAARLSLRVADAHVFVSSYLHNQARRMGGWTASRSYVVPYGLSRRFRREARRNVQVEAPTYRLAAIQSPLQHKDNESLLQTFRHLVAMHPDKPWRLDVAGWRGWGQWQRRARQLGIAERVNWLGFLDEEQIIELLSESDCLIFPSVFEGFGLPVIEAMACGCPVVAVEATAVPEVAGGAALLVPPRSPSQMAQRVACLLEDEEQRRTLIGAGKSHAMGFCWKETARAFQDIFATVGDPKRRPGRTIAACKQHHAHV